MLHQESARCKEELLKQRIAQQEHLQKHQKVTSRFAGQPERMV